MYDYTNLILHPYESSHILTAHHLLIDLTNCLSCCLEFFFWGGDDHPTILGREYMVIPTMVIHVWITVIHHYMETTRAWAQWKSMENCNHTSTRFDLTIPLQKVLMPLGGIQELQCLVSSELISLCPAVVDTPFKSSFQSASANKSMNCRD